VTALQNPATNKMNRLIFLVSLASGLIMGLQSRAQVAVPFKSADDTVHYINIIHTDTLKEESKDSTNKVQSLYGHVELQQEKTLFFCDSVAMNQSTNIIEAFGHVHINDKDSMNIYSKYMKYFVDKKLIIFQKQVSMTDGKNILTTEELQYDRNARIGTYSNGGKVINGLTVVTSKDGTYYADTKDVYFKRNVILKDPAYDLKADSLLYNSKTRIATFITETFIRDSSGRTILTKDGYYDLLNHKAHFDKRATITDSSQTIIADDIRFDDSTGVSIAQGAAIFRDTSQGTTVMANLMIANKKNNTLLATEKPVMILKENENDSIYVSADTLFSGKFSDSLYTSTDSTGQIDSIHRIILNPDYETDSSNRYLQGFHHVRIYSDSMQAVSDSLFYNGKDSVFQLFSNPIVWASGYQVTGDTIYMYTKNKKPQHLSVFENGLAVSKTGENMYNQVKGKTLNGYFKDGNIDYMRAKGNAESIYFIKDDSMALVGVNKVNSADIIDMIFLNKELNKVILRNDPDAEMFPIRKVKLEDMRLRDFKWFEDKRPKTKNEILQQ
jgi:lipopolysaccharide export system protein LptA